MPSATTPEPTGPVILFDGVCNLCNGAVQWLIERDPEAHFRFAALQSAAAASLLRTRLPEDWAGSLPDSIVLVDEAGVHVESDAALRIARLLPRPHRWLSWSRVLPRFFRDPVYRFVARNRYRWFGERDACMVPTPELRERFLD